MRGEASKLIAPRGRKPYIFARSGAGGTTLLELVVVVAIVSVLLAISVPGYQSSMKSMHLSSATTAITGAIQSTRYKAIVSGCQYTIAFSQANTNYQIAGQSLSGNPPSCGSLANVGSALPWSTSGDVSLKVSSTLTFYPAGTMTATGGSTPCTNGIACLILSNGTTTTSTIIVSGVGNVKVTSP
jgi:type IV fimbrial biogenesis protein FimT